jgi:hypothetical protein
MRENAMRKILIAGALAAAVCGLNATPALAQANPPLNYADPAMQTPAGRAYLCRQRLHARGYPESYLRLRPGRGVVWACARQLGRAWRRHRA